MKLIGFFVLAGGWLIALAAAALLKSDAPRAAFVVTGIAIEILGLVVVFRSHRPMHEG